MAGDLLKYEFIFCAAKYFWVESWRVINRWKDIMESDSCSRLHSAMWANQN
jgi:hypothetical protein